MAHRLEQSGPLTTRTGTPYAQTVPPLPMGSDWRIEGQEVGLLG